jgi:methionyl-tRNA formyltransferase
LTKRKKQWLYNREDRKGNSHGDRETGTEKSGTEVMCTGIHAVPAEAVGVCGEDLLKVNEVQAEGKKRMTSDAFLRGSRLEKGMELGK